jgi:hypothetical protein
MRAGDLDTAARIESDVLERRYRVWGDDHPATVESDRLLHAVSLRDQGGSQTSIGLGIAVELLVMMLTRWNHFAMQGRCYCEQILRLRCGSELTSAQGSAWRWGFIAVVGLNRNRASAAYTVLYEACVSAVGSTRRPVDDAAARTGRSVP